MIPIGLKLLVQQLEADFFPRTVLCLQTAQIPCPVPYGQFHHLTAFSRLCIENMENPCPAASSFRAGNSREILNAVAGSGALRLAVVGIDIHKD